MRKSYKILQASTIACLEILANYWLNLGEIKVISSNTFYNGEEYFMAITYEGFINENPERD